MSMASGQRIDRRIVIAQRRTNPAIQLHQPHRSTARQRMCGGGCARTAAQRQRMSTGRSMRTQPDPAGGARPVLPE
jgi:hypothetical protein